MNYIKMRPFPEVFLEGNSHMFLIEKSETEFEMYPPNQCDWVYKLTKISETEWHVTGDKENDHMENTYVYEDEDWIVRH